jgi:hypothetical protein
MPLNWVLLAKIITNFILFLVYLLIFFHWIYYRRILDYYCIYCL